MTNHSIDYSNWQEISVEDNSVGKRVDVFLSEALDDISRTYIQKFFTADGVFVNDRPVKKNFLLKSGDVVKFLKIKSKKCSLNPTPAPIDIIFEDESLIVIDKRPGIVVHGGNGTRETTLVEMVLSHCDLSQLGGELRPGVVHRLDKETSGVIIFAKTDKAYLSLQKQFSRHVIKKKYSCIVHGNFSIKTGIIDEPIGRSRTLRTRMCVTTKGREARTIWNLCNNFKSTALLSVNTITGRTHQIRVHLSHIGHPILGDRTYGQACNTNAIECDRVMLHAMNLELVHPVTGKEMGFFSNFPDDFAAVIDRLSEDANK
ncbi:MAG: RluA family pseudouridine synthase [Puniceicoccales bacterium]|jgi:23S rRNA pseudouridine1911/1915/1917 synthase|nr:RluA family pseudouridine synthase [Puniceicoccales bacterium]